MKNYSYLEAVTADVIDYIRDQIDYIRNDVDTSNRDALAEFLNDELWIDDGVTGNASGSYTFSRYKAQQFVMSDPDTVMEALEELCATYETIAKNFLSQNWEYFDVIARCYVLGQAIEAALDSLESELSFNEEE